MGNQSTNAKRIRELNDAYRKAGPLLSGNQSWLLTSGVTAKGSDFVIAAIHGVMAFDVFNTDNDPYGEHDFGSLSVEGSKVFWKIDYYDIDLKHGSPDPANPDVTRRVMTIMLASEY